MGDLDSRHLAELHTLAAGLGVPRYRALPRDRLIAEIQRAHLADLHALAARAGIPGYRKLRRTELLARLSG